MLMFVKALLQVGARLQADGRGDEEAETLLRFGARLKEEGRNAEAIDAFTIVTRVAKSEHNKQTHASVAYYNLGNIHRLAFLYDKAQICFGIAVKLNPGYHEARLMQAHCLIKLGEVDAALKIQLTDSSNPPRPFSRIDRFLPKGAEGPENGVDAESLRRMLAALNYSEAVARDEVTSRHELWGRDVRAAVGKIRKHRSRGREPDRPLRVGYISADLRDHVVARFFAAALRDRDRAQFHATCSYPGTQPPAAVSGR